VISVGFFVDKGEAVVWRGPMVHRLLQQFLGDVDWGELDYLVCDLPPGTGDVQLSLSQLIPIAGAVMVTTPQEIAIIDVVKGIAMFEKVEIPILGIIENMSYYKCPACGHSDEIFSHGGGKRLAQEVGAEFFGEIPIDNPDPVRRRRRRADRDLEPGLRERAAVHGPGVEGRAEDREQRAVQAQAIAAAGGDQVASAPVTGRLSAGYLPQSSTLACVPATRLP